ncbi:ras-related protein Rab-15-like [Cyanistes caeruleus]|nr:ras-related protein Rab-15-like [Cyanistes caeruleus]XP_023773644.1 ras-related protein Rab-15-like [Cyanistes caeruleus]XP_023773645.1 ras-related protein Rab-15-like [Cyanistes caeruleus]
MKTIEVDGIKVRIQIWDTAGQERYQTITKQYYRRAQGIFLVYDISSERSYQHIVKWASDVDEYAPDGVQKILIGNKADEEHKRQVPKEQGLQVSGGCCVLPPRGQDPSCTPSMASLFLSPLCTRDPNSPPAALPLSGTPRPPQPLPPRPGTLPILQSVPRHPKSCSPSVWEPSSTPPLQ